MIVFYKIEGVSNFLIQQKKMGKTIGFVPTMGALHNGHLSLVGQAKSENDLCVASIFVNPIQFNKTEDLDKYPRTLEADLQMLKKQGCDVVFAPDTAEMYPEPDTTVFDFGYLGEIMEGKHRPGHFNGVAIVVKKLFEIINPTRAYFGEKDFQQLAIIKKLVNDLSIDVAIISHPIVREDDGLAMSSRNMRLTPEQRTIAPKIYSTLLKSKTLVKTSTVSELEHWVKQSINAIEGMEVEYFEIIDYETLLKVNDWNSNKKIIGCIVVNMENIRLLDNLIL